MIGISISGILSAGAALVKAISVVGMAVQGIKIIGNAITSLAKALGLVKPQKNVEELGARAIQAEEKGIKPENFDSFRAWFDKIQKDDWGFDPEKAKDMDPREMIEKGMKAAADAIQETFPQLPIEEFVKLAVTNEGFFTDARMGELGKLGATDVDAFGKVLSYVIGKASDFETVDVAVDELAKIEKSITAGISDTAAYEKAASFRGLK